MKNLSVCLLVSAVLVVFSLSTSEAVECGWHGTIVGLWCKCDYGWTGSRCNIKDPFSRTGEYDKESEFERRQKTQKFMPISFMTLLIVIGVYVLCCVCGCCLGKALNNDHVPRVGTTYHVHMPASAGPTVYYHHQQPYQPTVQMAMPMAPPAYSETPKQ